MRPTLRTNSMWLMVTVCGLLWACSAKQGDADAEGGTAGTSGAEAGSGGTGGSSGGGCAAGMTACAGAGGAAGHGGTYGGSLEDGGTDDTDAGYDAGAADAGRDAGAGDASTTNDAGSVDLDRLHEMCGAGNSCPNGLTPITYCGFAGCPPEFCSCELPCEDGPEACPEGTVCATVSDGPGAVCTRP